MQASEMAQLCRLCLAQTTIQLDIFTKRIEFCEETYAEIMNKFLEHKVGADDQLPKTICEPCSAEVLQVYRFKSKCERSYKLLIEQLQSTKMELLEEDANAVCDSLLEEDWDILKKVCNGTAIKCEPKEQQEESNHFESSLDFSTVEESCTLRRYPVRLSRSKRNEQSTQASQITTQSSQNKTQSMKSLFHCSDCSGFFNSNHNLQAHKPLCKRKRSYACHLCCKYFTQSHHLRDHLLVHAGERPHKCAHCPRSFIQKSNLQAHIHIHTGESPYKCNDCEKTYARNYDLKVHMHVHQVKRPYPCSLCSKGFLRRRDLVRHIRVHTGDQPYKCTQCPMTFSRKDQLNIHISTYHTNENSKSPPVRRTRLRAKN